MKFLFVGVLLVLSLNACKPDASVAPGTLSGEITIDATLQRQADPNAVLYIIARKEVGPPLAVKKVTQPQFPLPYALSQADVMLPGMSFQGEVMVSARLDKDGNAGPLQSGDMTGATARTVPIGQGQVDITIDTLIP